MYGNGKRAMKQTKTKYRAIADINGELLPGFADEDGDPLVFNIESVTYFPDSMTAIEETNKERMKNLIKDKKYKERKTTK